MIGKRVHVTRFNGENVDFYATLEEGSKYRYRLSKRTDVGKYVWGVVKEGDSDFGKDRMYYYEIVSDDSEKEVDLKDFGIIEVENKDTEFKQYNDFPNHKTFYGCPRCNSLNVKNDEEMATAFRKLIAYVCLDCRDTELR